MKMLDLLLLLLQLLLNPMNFADLLFEKRPLSPPLPKGLNVIKDVVNLGSL